MIQTFFEIDEDGYIVNKYKIDKHREEVPEYLVERWEGVISKPRYIREIGKWIEMAKDYEVLGFSSIDGVKREKDKELNKACSKAIVNGFKHTIDSVEYHFSYDKEAQVNFQETYHLFQNDVVNHVMWTARYGEGKVRIPLTKESFNEVYYESVKHKLNTISYYRDVLAVELSRAKTVDEIQAIRWQDNITIDAQAEIKSGNTIEDRIIKNEIAQAEGDAELLNILLMGMMM